MTIQLPEWFVPKYQDAVTTRAQQKKRRLDGLTADFGIFHGKECHFPRFGMFETFKSSRMAALKLANADQDWVKVAADPEFCAFGIWDPDKVMLTIPAADHYASGCVKAVNRAHDRVIVEALGDAGTNGVQNTKGSPVENIQTIGDYNTVADLETIVSAIVALGTNEMFEDETISIVAPFKLRVQQALDPYLAKTDMKSNRPWDDINWRTYEKLPGNGANGEGWLAGGATGVDMYIWAKDAVASADQKGDTPIVERLGAQLTDMMGTWFSSCAKVLEPKGVIRIKSKLDFDLSRHPIFTKEVA